MSSVELIDYMGDDLSVVNAARVSMDKQGEWEWDWEAAAVFSLREADKKLINYLAKHGHWSPFAHTSLSFRVSAPIFIARQLAKHQVGFSWNEVSRRYVDKPPEFETLIWRKRAENVKQGSGEEFNSGRQDHFDKIVHRFEDDALKLYTYLLDEGVCPEQARSILPQSMLTEWIWTGSLYGFSRVYKQRTDKHSQKEASTIAKEIGKHCKDIFPVSWEALTA